jgi:hypothetical protein
MENLIKPDNVAVLIMMIMIGFFTLFAFYQAISNDRKNRKIGETSESEREREEVIRGEKIHTWPYLVRKEFLMAILVIDLLLLWSIFIDAPLEGHSNPNLTPNPAKAPWYFLGLQEMLVYFDPWIAGVVLPLFIIIGLMLIPYLDINPKGNGYFTFAERRFSVFSFSFGFLVLWITLIIIGVFMRGPGWLWFWPWQRWDPNRVASDVNIDLTQLMEIDSRSTLGLLIGGCVILLYFSLGMVLPYLYLWFRKGDFLHKLGLTRYLVVSFLFWTMIGLPLKIILRLTLHIKYIWVTPWFNL